ncbi:hypothetical protein YN1HA_19250 [Sulfurisphaera ohwakuensis]
MIIHWQLKILRSLYHRLNGDNDISSIISLYNYSNSKRIL